MSAQRVGARLLRRMSAAAGTELLRGWSHGGYWLNFVTPDHRHGSYHTTTREIRWWLVGDFCCYTTCRELPPIQYGPPA